jgi:hypothetical protein
MKSMQSGSMQLVTSLVKLAVMLVSMRGVAYLINKLFFG